MKEINVRAPSRAGPLRWLYHKEESWRTLCKAVVAEFLGTAFFLFIATGAVTAGCHAGDIASRTAGGDTTLTNARTGSCFLQSTNLLNIALAFGLSIFVLVYATASFSGGNLNTAVTCAFLIAGKISLLRAVLYIGAQLAGACVGSALIKVIDVNGYRAATGAANQLSAYGTPVGAWALEAILTFLLVLVVFAATDADRATGTAHLPVLAPLAIGITVFLAHLVAVPIDGCSINPARSFGAAVVSNTWNKHWIFWVGPLTGGVLAALAYEIFLRTHESKAVRHQRDVEAAIGPPAATAVLPAYAGVRGMREATHPRHAPKGRTTLAGAPAATHPAATRLAGDPASVESEVVDIYSREE